eukprot:165869_1
MSNNEQTQQALEEIKEQLAEMNKFIKKSSAQGKTLKELQQKVKFLEERLDDNHPMDMARDFTYYEIKNICIKAIAQGLSFYLAYLLLGVFWESSFKDMNKNNNSNNKNEYK